MREGIRLILEQTQYFGLVLSIGAYLFACWLKNKTKLAILNPLLVSAALIIACILGVGCLLYTSIFPKFSQVLALIPNPVLGGILLVTFGNIIASGIKVIGFDENNKRNFTIIALAAAVGIGGNFAQAAGTLAFLPSTVVTLFTGISGTAITALVLNIILPGEKKEEA